jgi:ParB family chromosome partitioning protein
MVRRGLGKGLEALIPNIEEKKEKEGVIELNINDIEPNVGQPRKNFDDQKLLQLSESIKQHGIVQPLIVKKDGNVYKIVAGERRWRAARLAKLKTVPVIVKELSGKQTMEIALIENIQREDLNPIEEAEAYEKLINEYNMTQEEISKSVGKSRPAIANAIRLLSLQDRLKEMVINGSLTSGHARALLSISDTKLQLEAAEYIVEKQLSVRETEKFVKQLLNTKTSEEKDKKNKKDTERAEAFKYVEEKFIETFGTKVKIMDSNNKGKIVIEYYSLDELNRIVELVEGFNKT